MCLDWLLSMRRLHIDCMMMEYRLHIDCMMMEYRLCMDCMMMEYRLCMDCIMSEYRLCMDGMMIAHRTELQHLQHPQHESQPNAPTAVIYVHVDDDVLCILSCGLSPRAIEVFTLRCALLRRCLRWAGPNGDCSGPDSCTKLACHRERGPSICQCNSLIQ